MSSPSYAKLGVGFAVSAILLAMLAKASASGDKTRTVKLEADVLGGEPRTYRITKFSDPNHFKVELMESSGSSVRAFVEFNAKTTLGAGGSFAGIKQVLADTPKLAVMDPFSVSES